MDYNKAFSELTSQEFAVIYWKCQDLTHPQIAEVLHWGMDNVQKYTSRAHKKLGMGELLAKRREELLESEICPALRTWIKAHTDALNDLRPPEQPQIPEEVETVFGEEVDSEEEERLRKEAEERRRVWEEERKKRDEEQRKKNGEKTINIPPQPLLRSGPRTIWWWIVRLGGLGVFCLCLVVVVWAIRGFPGINIPQQVASSTDVSRATSTVGPTPTSIDTPSPTDTPPPTLTFTPEISPTAIPLPIRENFNQQYSDLWRVSGDPIMRTGTDYQWDGVLTTRGEDRASLSIGNTAWNDYAIKFRASHHGGNTSIVNIGVRIVDLNNMIEISCIWGGCDVTVIYNGERDEILTDKYIEFSNQATVTVQGNTITLFGDIIYGDDTQSTIILPPKYTDKLLNGGIYFEISNIEVDYIEILPLK